MWQRDVLFAIINYWDSGDFISRTRQDKRFAKEKLEMNYGERHINILRILDSKGEKVNLGRVYEERVSAKEIRIFNILTRLEIE